MPRNTRPEYVSFQDLLDEATVVETAPVSRGRALLTLLAAAVITGIAVTAIAIPPALAAGAATRAAIAFWNSLPTDLPVDKVLPQATVLLDKDGNQFATLSSENREDVTFENISTNFFDALVSSEDARFYSHHGYDPVGIVRAFASNTSSGSVNQGASTITQQLVHNILIANATTKAEKVVADDVGYQAKLRGIKYAIALEKKWSKNQILTAYANDVYFGNGAYGIQAAARTYFNTTAKDLTVAQSALLVAQVKSPTGFDPFLHPTSAQHRRDWIIDRMVSLHRILPAAGAAAKNTPITLTRGSTPSGCDVSAYPYYCSLVRDEILTDPAFGATDQDRQETLRRGGLTLTTALDRHATDAAQQAATSSLGNDNQFAAGTAIVVPGTGHIAAVAQNRTWDQTQLVYATSPAQPGSSFKAIDLAAALDAGVPATTTFYSNGPYRPAGLDSPPGGFTNDGGERAGTINAQDAMRMSINVYYVKLIEKVGVRTVADMAHRLGIASIPDNLNGSEASLALGSYDVTPLEMANAYSAFIAGGTICSPVAVIGAVSRDTGKAVPFPDPACHQALATNVANTLATVLKAPLTAGGTLAAVGPIPGHETAAKTGTTDNSAAVWTVGMTTQYATAVWVGDPSGGQAHPVKNIRVNGRTVYGAVGATVAGPIWKTTMVAATAGLPNGVFPPADLSATGTVPAAHTLPVVPDLRGMSVDEAVTVLIGDRLTPSISKVTAADDGTTPTGVVVAQTPAAGTTAANPTVTVTLSHGSATNDLLPVK